MYNNYISIVVALDETQDFAMPNIEVTWSGRRL